MDINMTLAGQIFCVHILMAGGLTFIYGRRFAPSAGMSILAIFAWLVPLIGSACLAVFLVARHKRERSGIGADLEPQT